MMISKVKYANTYKIKEPYIIKNKIYRIILFCIKNKIIQKKQISLFQNLSSWSLFHFSFKLLSDSINMETNHKWTRFVPALNDSLKLYMYSTSDGNHLNSNYCLDFERNNIKMKYKSLYRHRGIWYYVKISTTAHRWYYLSPKLAA